MARKTSPEPPAPMEPPRRWRPTKQPPGGQVGETQDALPLLGSQPLSSVAGRFGAHADSCLKAKATIKTKGIAFRRGSE